MKTIDTQALPHRLLLVVASAVLLNGCVTISDPIEEPSPIPPSPTVEEAALLAAQPASTPVPNQAPNFLGVSDPKRNSPTPTPSPTPQAIATVHTVGEWENMRWISEKYAVSVEAIMAANGMTDPDKIVVGQQLNIPSANQIVQAMVATGTPIPVPRDESGHILHFIQAGETLSGIAEQYDISRDDLLFANGLRPDSLIMAGGTLIIPQGEYTPVPTATPLGPTPVPTLIVALEPSATSEASPTIAPSPEPVTYTVQAGDRAGAIARDNGITVPLLASANPGANMDALSVGQVLVIPPAPEAEGSATATSNTVEPTATPTEVPPVIVTHVVTEGENWKSIGEKYGVSEDVLKAANPSVTAEPEMDSSVQVPLGTPTPTPSPTALPTMTPTPAPAFAAPVLLLPANGTAATYRENMQPIHLLWTSTGILRQNEFYVARLRAVDGAGDVLWTETYWTQGPSWRLEEELLSTIAGTVTLRWDVMVMRRTSEAGEEPATGTALSEKSPTYEIVFTGPLPAPEVTSTSVESFQAAPTRTRTVTPTRTPTRTPSSTRRP
jgi:LysM repeat protein